MDWFIVDTMRYLSQNGFEVTLICNAEEGFVGRNEDFSTVISVPMKRGFDLAGTIRTIRVMTKIFRKEKFDIIQYATPNAALCAAVAAVLARTPIRLYTQWGVRYVGFSKIRRFFYRRSEKLICTLSTHIEPDSFGNLEFSRAEGLYDEKKSKVIGNGSATGINFDKFDVCKKESWRAEVRSERGLPEDAIVLGFVGRLDRDKGVNELLEAFRAISIDHPDTYLMIVGRNDKVDTLNNDLYRWSVTCPQVIYIGEVFDAERYLSAMDILVLPSYREGFGSVVIEAEAMEVPVIVTDIPGPSEAMIHGKTGLIVPKADVVALQDAMICLMNDGIRRKAMGQNGLDLVKERYDCKKLRDYILEDRKALIEKMDWESKK
jgi:glycosyltransferase involved in cell wall biosynthesis